MTYRCLRRFPSLGFLFVLAIMKLLKIGKQITISSTPNWTYTEIHYAQSHHINISEFNYRAQGLVLYNVS